MSVLTFLGRGSAFTDEHNCAFFKYNNKLYLLDCPMSAFHKLVNNSELLSGIVEIVVLVTHTHSDHIGGIPMLIHYCFYNAKIPVTVICPCQEIINDMYYFINNMDGCDNNAYRIVGVNQIDLGFTVRAIPTRHAMQLSGKCFGYFIGIGDKTIVYTGDTCTLQPFVNFLGKGTYLYTELAYYKSPVHLWMNDVLGILKGYANNGVRVYVMHLDNEKEIRARLEGSKIKIAPLYRKK